MWRTVACLALFCASIHAVASTAESDAKSLFRRDAKSEHSWNYEDKTGPTHWPQMFKKCGGSRQSPIDIDPDEVDENEYLDKIDFERYDDPLIDAEIKNNGHTVVITPNSNDPPRTIEDGGMDDAYKFLQVHFHWGADNKKGSEHTIDGQRFPLEMHLVHRSMKYKTQNAALEKEDGLAVLGVLFKLDDEDNPALEPIIDKLDDVRKEGSTAEIDDLELDDLLPDDLMPYYRYKGSLTTPPCSEAVIWTVFKDFAPISEKQLQQFRNVKEEDEGEPEERLVDNYRPVQPLNSRVVEISGMGSGAASFTSVSAMLLFMLVSLLVLSKRW